MQSGQLANRVKAANVDYHRKLADVYESLQPHFTKENANRVRFILQDAANVAGHKRFLDIGCGTGFLSNIAKDIFDEVIAIDITRELLDKVPQAGNVQTMMVDCEQLPFESNSINVCGAYSLLHHLPALRPTLKEACRVLVSGGIFYSDQDRNADYLEPLYDHFVGDWGRYATDSFAANDMYVDSFSKYGIDKGTMELAEYQNNKNGGFKIGGLRGEFNKAGFKNIEVTPRWFACQAEVDQSDLDSLIYGTMPYSLVVERYLKQMLPMSLPFFKYLQVVARK
jgi:SAM-dependent methyltransferase